MTGLKRLDVGFNRLKGLPPELSQLTSLERVDIAHNLDPEAASELPVERLAGHYHDTYGMAVANVFASLEMGVAVFDASVGGLGGCPYAAGASGNVATEDVVWLLNGLGIDTGIDLEALVDTAAWISAQLGREPASRVARAVLAKRAKTACA